MAQRINPEAFPPGEYIREELVERGWTQMDLAEGPTEIELPNGQRIGFRWSSAATSEVSLGPALIRTSTGADGRTGAVTWGENRRER